MMKQKVLIFTLLISMLTVISACLPESESERAENTAKASTSTALKGNKAPIFDIVSLAGEDVTVKAKGKPYIINFWATWCPPCRAEMPDLAEFYKTNKSKVDFYAINIQEDGESVAKFLADNNIELPVLLDKKIVASDLYGIRAIPTTLIVDKEGTIVYRKTGGVTKEELEKELEGI